MACGTGEIEITNYDGATYCVKGGSSSPNLGNGATGGATKGTGTTWDKIMEAADKILQGAEILTGNKSSKTTKKKGDFGSDVTTTSTGYPFDRTVNDANEIDDNKGINWVLVAGGVMGIAFLFLLWKLFSTPKAGGLPVATTAVPPSVK